MQDHVSSFAKNAQFLYDKVHTMSEIADRSDLKKVI
jgi:hypothetical protein